MIKKITEDQARDYLGQWADAGFSSTKLSQVNTVVGERAWRRRLKDARELCADTGIVVTDVPNNLRFTKTTVQYDAQGKLIQEWRRMGTAQIDPEDMARKLLKMVSGKCPKLPRPKKMVKSERCLVIPFYDVHIGKYAWKPETGEDYDIKIVQKILDGTTKIACDRSGPVDTVLLIIGGDFYHADGRTPQTERSGNVLDVDSRVEKVRDAAIASLYSAIAICSAIANKVEVICIPGNHDHESMHWTARILEAFYKKEKHITIDRSPNSRRYFEYGEMLLGIDHGMNKLGSYVSLMPCEQREAWSRTSERLWLLGHIHQQKVIQQHGVTVEHLESVSAADAWHAQAGYVGNPRRTVTFLLDKKYGLIRREYIKIGEVLG